MKVKFWGVRGSLPVPGSTTVRYGGNTSCVEILSGEGTRIIVDAGTGLRSLGKEILRAGHSRNKAHLLISHTHWDHIQGLPFFAPLYHTGSTLSVYARKRHDLRLRTVLANQTDAPYFPVPLDETRASVDFTELPDETTFRIDDVTVSTACLNHPYIATAYSVTGDGRKVAYVSDTAPFERILFGEEFVTRAPDPDAILKPADLARLRAMRAALVRLCEGADLVIYDTMFTDDDYRKMSHFGHSRPKDAIDVCRDAGARTLALYHHAPERNDEEVDNMLRTARQLALRVAKNLVVTAAYEGLELDLGSTR